MQLGMHTKRIQSAYKYKRVKREDSSFYFLFILPALLSFTVRDLQAIKLSLFVSSGIPRRTVNKPSPLPVVADSRLFWAFIARLTGCPPSFRLILIPRSSRVSAGAYAFRPFRCLDGRSKKLYALYASKSPLCMLCGNTTPKKTAYNAYRNANRRVRRAEGLKMYAVGDAYKVHTECIQAYKKRKRENSSFYFFLYCLFFYLPLPASSGIPQRIMNDLLPPVFADDGLFSGFHRPSDGLSAIIPTHS